MNRYIAFLRRVGTFRSHRLGQIAFSRSGLFRLRADAAESRLGRSGHGLAL
jgi:hypothetical protein